MILRWPLTTPPCLTMPSISEMTAGPRGLRASNSSTTRGRPPVMSLVLVVSRGIFASTSPACTVSPSCTIRCACDGMWYLRMTLPSLSLISIAGCFFSSGESTMMKRDRPVTSSTSSWTVMPSMMSLNRIWPGSSVRIENVYGSHSTQHLALLDLLAVLHLQARAVDDRIALAVAALRVLHDERAAAVHDDQLAASLCVSTTCRPSKWTVPGVPRFERGLLGDARRRAADVERAHRQLRAGLADRLRGDDADRLAELDQPAGGEVAAVALRADAAARRAGQHRADLHLLDAGVLDRRRLVLVDLLVDVDDRLAGERVDDLLERRRGRRCGRAAAR